MTKIDIPNSWAYKNFITLEEQNVLLEFSHKQYAHLQENGHGRFYVDHVDTKFSVPEEYKIVKQRIVDTENLKNFLFDPKFGDFLSFNTVGAAIHPHKDPNVDGYVHTRYNLLLSVPESGGKPIYNNKIFDVEERMLWRCEAGLYNHASTPVVGDRSRINISFGFQLKKE
jgi:hypothetical protein